MRPLTSAAMRRLLVAAALAVALSLLAWARRAARRAPATAASPPSAAAAAESGPSPARAAVAAEGGRRKAEGAPRPTRPFARGELVIHGGYGSGPGQFGRRRDPESNPEAPMAVAAGPDGELAMIDQVNRRILVYRHGKLMGTISTGGDTAQDIAFGKDGRLLVLDRLVDGNVQVYGADGQLADSLTLAGKGVPEGGAVTGLFTDDEGTYVERDHEALVRIAGPDGKPDPDRPELVGRPSRDGRTLLAAAIGDREAGEVVVRAVDRASGQPLWSQSLRLGAPILHIMMLDSDRNGMVYLAADVGREGAQDPFPILDERIAVVRLGSGGAPRGSLELPPLPGADESFRPITVGDDGAVYVMAAGETELAVTRYTF